MRHELKIWPQYYQAVANGSKTFEVRKNDRAFQKGDEVVLREYDPDKSWEESNNDGNSMFDSSTTTRYGMFTGSPLLEFKIGYVLPIDAERVVFSLIPLK